MSESATVSVADVLELRGDGLSLEEIWSLLCQAVKTLQDLLQPGKITDNSIVPLVRPQTLRINNKGSVVISLARDALPGDAYFLAPEYQAENKRKLNNLSLEKMWVYSIGRSLLASLKSDSTTGEPLAVLNLMTEEEPPRRASLVSLLSIISNHRRRSLPLKPFSDLVAEMYWEVFGTRPQCLLPPVIPERNERQDDETLGEYVPLQGSRVESSAAEMRKKTASPLISLCDSCDSSKAEVKRNPVQRAPSRLHRGPSVTDVKAGEKSKGGSCVGPEFVVRAGEEKVVQVVVGKASRKRSLTVILLTGQRIRVACDPRTITCGRLFEIVEEVERLEDSYIFGLACTINGDLVFIPSETKLREVAPSGWKKNRNCFPFVLYLRVKLFLPSLRGVKSSRTRHLMYLQLRRSLLEQQIKCERHELLPLGGLALQAEFGNFEEGEYGTSSYFLLEHYLPDELIDNRKKLEEMLQQCHKSRFGMDPSRAEEIFVAQVQRLAEYGSHHYTALWVRKSESVPMWVTVTPSGLCLYEKKKNVLDRKIYEAFVWKNIQSFKCTEKYFRIDLQCFGQKITSYKLRLHNKKSVFLLRMAAFHHQFFLRFRMELSPLHVLSQEFSISLDRQKKLDFYVERKEEWDQRQGTRPRMCTPSCHKKEKQENKDNESPVEGAKNTSEKRSGVKMGVRAFQVHPQKDGPEISTPSHDSYVIDSSIRSSDEKSLCNFYESIPVHPSHKLEELSWEEEEKEEEEGMWKKKEEEGMWKKKEEEGMSKKKKEEGMWKKEEEGMWKKKEEEGMSKKKKEEEGMSKKKKEEGMSKKKKEEEGMSREVDLTKDKYGSYGLDVIEGAYGGLFVADVHKTNEDDDDGVRRGDQLMSVNGTSLLNLDFSEALAVFKNAGDRIQVVVSEGSVNDPRQKPLEHEYLRAVFYETPIESDATEPDPWAPLMDSRWEEEYDDDEDEEDEEGETPQWKRM